MLRFHSGGLYWESCRTMGVFVLLLGFPGVGKLTIAKELGSLLSAKIMLTPPDSAPRSSFR